MSTVNIADAVSSIGITGKILCLNLICIARPLAFHMHTLQHLPLLKYRNAWHCHFFVTFFVNPNFSRVICLTFSLKLLLLLIFLLINLSKLIQKAHKEQK